MQGIKISFPIFGDQFILNPPSYFTVFGRPVYFYAVIIACGFALAAFYILKRRDEFGLSQDNVLDLFIIAVPSGIVGARLYYVIFNPAEYFGPGKWGNIIEIWEGGLALYGGVISAAVAIYIYSRIKKIPVAVYFDVGGLGLLIGQAIGRWGNFINREAYGGETDLPWKMGLTTESGTIYVHPTFLYESIWNVIGFILIHRFSKKYRKYDGQIFLCYVAWYGFGRFLVEGLRTDSLYLFSTDIRISQLVAVLSFGVAVVLLLRNKYRQQHKIDTLYVNKVNIKPDSEYTKTEQHSAAPESSTKISETNKETSEKTSTKEN